jgi:hypothetical protein
MNYLKVLLKSILTPGKTFKKLAHSNNSIPYGWLTVTIFALLYTLTVYSFHIKELVPLLDYFLPVKKHEYYFYQSFVTFPVTIIGVIINYQVIKGLLKRYIISYNYKRLWGPVTIASVLPAFFILWFIETILIVSLGWNHFTFDVIRITVGIAWTIFLNVKAVQVVEGIKKNQSIGIGFFSSLMMFLWWGLFFR